MCERRQDFIDFINRQDPERRIDHCGGWKACAVGDFAREVEGIKPEELDVWIGRLVNELFDDDEDVYSDSFFILLNKDYSRQFTEPYTYGQLQSWLDVMQYEAHHME